MVEQDIKRNLLQENTVVSSGRDEERGHRTLRLTFARTRKLQLLEVLAKNRVRWKTWLGPGVFTFDLQSHQWLGVLDRFQAVRKRTFIKLAEGWVVPSNSRRTDPQCFSENYVKCSCPRSTTYFKPELLYRSPHNILIAYKRFGSSLEHSIY